MKKHPKSLLLLVIVLLSISFSSQSQTHNNKQISEPSKAAKNYYQQWKFESLSLTESDVVNYGFLQRKAKDNMTKTLLVFIEGSGHRSAFGLKDGERWVKLGNALGFSKMVFTEYDFLVPEKTNVTIGGEHSNDQKMVSHYTVENRSQGTAAVINSFLKKNDYSRVVLLGVSEGGYILPKVYKSLDNKKAITEIVIWGSGGLSQYEEFVLLAKSEVSMPPKKRDGYKAVNSAISDINAYPTSIEKRYWGYSYLHWSSFFAYSPIDDLVEIDIPILILHGALDNSSPVESARMVKQRFEQLGKINLTYYEYANIGHGPETPEEDKLFIGDLVTWLQNR